MNALPPWGVVVALPYRCPLRCVTIDLGPPPPGGGPRPLVLVTDRQQVEDGVR